MAEIFKIFADSDSIKHTAVSKETVSSLSQENLTLIRKKIRCIIQSNHMCLVIADKGTCRFILHIDLEVSKVRAFDGCLGIERR